MSEQTRRAVLQVVAALPVLTASPQTTATPTAADFDLTTRAGWEALARALQSAAATADAAGSRLSAAQEAAWAQCGARPDARDTVASAHYLSRLAEVERRLNVAALERESERLDGVRGDLEALALETPAPDREALTFKLDLLDSDCRVFGVDMEADRWNVFSADVRRLLTLNV